MKERHLEIHLFIARFKESQGEIEGSNVEYELLDSKVPLGLLKAIIKHVNFEHR